MKTQVYSSVLIVVLSATQVFGPATLWAVEERVVRLEESRQVVLVAIDGASLMVQKGNETKAAQFREVVYLGECLVIDSWTMAELLIGIRAVVMLGPGTTAQLLTVSDEQTTIQVSQGLIRVAAASSRLGPQGVVAVQTPTGQVQTHGGIVRVQLEAQAAKAERQPMSGAYAYRVSSVPERMAVVTSSNGELIQVDEGTAEILGAGRKTVAIQAGQRVTFQAAACGLLMNSANQPFTLANGAQLKVAGVDHNVVLPNNFYVFAGNGAAAKVNIGADDALFQVKGNSQLTINGVKVQ